MTDTTKTVTIEGKDYVIRRSKIKDQRALANLSPDAPEYQVEFIRLHVVTPTLTSADIEDMDTVVSTQLGFEISVFNMPPDDFLDRSQKLLEQAKRLRPFAVMSPPSGKGTS